MRWKVVVAVALIAAVGVVLRVRFVDTVTVSSDSMAPTICTGDVLLLARLDDGNAVVAGDIVTFTSPLDGRQAIKRVVAVGGQQVSIADAYLVVDGVRVDEPYVDHATIDGVYFGTVTVPAGSVFVMGDHREDSVDSREYGAILRSAVDGRFLFGLWSGCDN